MLSPSGKEEKGGRKPGGTLRPISIGPHLDTVVDVETA